MAATPITFDQWTFNKRIVEQANSKKFASAKTIVVSAGPAHFRDVVAGAPLYPIGIMQQFGFQEQVALTRIFEIGSRKPYFIRGRDSNRANLSSVMFDGPNILRMLYKSVPTHEDTFKGDRGIRPALNEDSPIWQNIASVAFEDSCGLYLYIGSFEGILEDALQTGRGTLQQSTTGGINPENRNTVYASYLEGAQVDSRSFNVDANATIVGETVGLQWEQSIPIT